MNDNYFVINKETNKIELHFNKSMYLGLDEETKKAIKSTCLFSRFGSCWVSRGFVGSWSALKVKEIAEKIGLENVGAEGERLSFAEQMDRKAERAECRAERYEERAERAAERGAALQKPIESMHGDIAFFTQPNINTSSGRAFTNKRNRMWAAWENGFEEFKKSKYWTDRAETARQTAKGCKLQPIDFCERRIKECNHDIKSLGKDLENNKKLLERIESGEEVRRGYFHDGEIITADEVNDWIDSTIERIEAAVDKAAYYQAMIDEQGGQKYNKDNINVGDIVKTVRGFRGLVEVTRKGTKNFSGKSLNSGWPCEFSYAEITEVVKNQEGEREIKHGFKAGDVYTVKMYDYSIHEYKPATVTIVKVTADKATVKVNNERAKSVAIRNSFNGDYYIPVQTSRDHYEWLHAKTENTETA